MITPFGKIEIPDPSNPVVKPAPKRKIESNEELADPDLMKEILSESLVETDKMLGAKGDSKKAQPKFDDSEDPDEDPDEIGTESSDDVGELLSDIYNGFSVLSKKIEKLANKLGYE